jgi:hypothetical protein
MDRFGYFVAVTRVIEQKDSHVSIDSDGARTIPREEEELAGESTCWSTINALSFSFLPQAHATHGWVLRCGCWNLIAKLEQVE